MTATIAQLLIVFGGLALVVGWKGGAIRLIMLAVGVIVLSRTMPHLTIPLHMLALLAICVLLFFASFTRRRR